MHQQPYPRISSKDFKPTSQQHLSEVLAYLKQAHWKHLEMSQKQIAVHKKVSIDEKVFKKLEQLTRECAKVALKYPEQWMEILKELTAFFMNWPHASIITLIMNLLGPDMKFQAISSQSPPTEQQSQSNSAIALPMAEQNIIALSDSRQCTVIALHQASDIGVQQNRQVHEQYYIEDDSKVGEYLQKPFRTVKRQGISDIFQHTASYLSSELVEKLLSDNLILNLSVDCLIALLKLLQHISTPLYTFYFLTLVKQLSSTILSSFSLSLQQQQVPPSYLCQQLCTKLKRTQYEQLIYAVRGLAERWMEHKGDLHIDEWEWQMEKAMLVRFVSSSTSEKQLHAVKTLIDRTRKVQYNSYSVLSLEELLVFIQEHKMLQLIYKADNHPEVIIKGKQLFEFVSKHTTLTRSLIDLIFELIPKSNQHICKALYPTLQATGHTNLQTNRQYIMTRISALPRASLFHNQTFTLIEALILLAPIQVIAESLKYLHQIIHGHYFGLKPQLKHKLLNIYFEVYMMGVEEGEFDTSEERVMLVLEPFLQDEQHVHSRLTYLVVDKFISMMKEHLPKKIGPKCKQILPTCVTALFQKYKLHLTPYKTPTNQQNQLHTTHLSLIKQLLECCDKHLTKSLLPEKQLWSLIEEDSYFGRFLADYSTDSQMYLLEKLIAKTNITLKDVENIVEAYYFMDKKVRDNIFGQIYQLFCTNTNDQIQHKLVEFIVKVQNPSAQHLTHLLLQQTTKPTQHLQLQNIASTLTLLKHTLAHHDKQGCGSYPAFKYLTNDYSLKVKILNMVDVFNPTNFQLQQKNHRTLYDLVKRLLPLLNKSLKQIKLKIDKNDKYLTLQQLKQKLNTLTPYRQMSLTVEQSTECQWYDHSLLINTHQQLNPEIAQILKQVFSQYCEEVNNQKRLLKEGACRIFQRATNVDTILANDMRILHLFNNYSETGEYLSVHEWVNFYYQSALVNPYLVVNNLKNLGYGEVFQSASEMIENFSVGVENVFRKYFAENQEIYEELFGLVEKLRQRTVKESGENGLAEKISWMALEVLKELPTYERLEEQVMEEFFSLSKSSSNEWSKMVEQHDQSQLVSAEQQPIQKVYFKSLILTHRLETAEQPNEKKNTNSMEEKTFKTITLYSLQKVERFAIQKTKQLFQQLVYSRPQQSINPLQLTSTQQTTIASLQAMSNLLTQPTFHAIHQIKTTLQLQPHQLTPLTLQCTPSNPSLNCKPHACLITNLSSLSSLNNSLLLNCATVLLHQLVNCRQEQVLAQIVDTFILPDNIFVQEVNLNKIANRLVYLLSDAVDGIASWYMLGLLEENKLKIFTEESLCTLEYFKTVYQLLLIETDPQILNPLLKLVHSILEQATKSYSYADFFQNKHLSDTMQGLLLTLKTLTYTPNITHKLNPKITTLCQWLLTNFVLSPGAQSYLYQILSSTASASDNLTFAYKLFTELQLKKNSKLNTQNLNECGMYNLGCICYINSIFQQLYHIDSFTEAITHTQLKQQPAEQYSMQKQLKQQQAEPYFVQFQKLFFSLKYSKRAFLIPHTFCQVYTDYTGLPINIKEQHDADEFLNNLLDKFENTYQTTYNLPKCQTLPKKLFQGSMANVITCQHCFTQKPNFQEFYVLSLQIKNHSTLQQCLDKMIEPEVICDYFCTTCDQKLPEIHKHRKLHSLPPILFLHFQRLVFDLETFTKIKLDHPVNFGEEIDLQNYFEEEQAQPVKYKLSGFVVHFGNSEGGHYVSLVKKGSEWKKYDDSRVSKWFWKTGVHEKQNAYLLIYERVEDENQMIEQEQSVNEQLPQSNAKLVEQITHDNILLSKEITAIRPDFGKFLISSLQHSSTSQIINSDQQSHLESAMLLTKLIWKYLKLIAQAKTLGFAENLPVNDNELEFLTVKFIQTNHSPQVSEHFLDIAVETQLVKSFYTCPEKKLRQVFSVILANVLSTWDKFFSNFSYLLPVKQNETVRKLMAQVENALSDVGKNYSKMDEYFEFLFAVSNLLPKVREYFKEINIVPKLVHFIMHKDSKLTDKFALYPMNAPNNKKVPSFNTILDLLALYLHQYPELTSHELVISSLSTKGFEFYKKLYQDRYENHLKLNTVMVTFLKGNFELTNRVIDELILSKINRFSHEDFYVLAFLDLTYCVLSIDDQYKEYRMHRILGIPTLLIDPTNPQSTLLTKKNQRLVVYWPNLITSNDETILPLLEQLFTNKDTLNYFSLTGVVYLLQLMKENKLILDYIAGLPSPCLACETYVSWVGGFIKNSLKRVESCEKFLEKVDVKMMLNKISVLLEEVEGMVEVARGRNVVEKNCREKCQNQSEMKERDSEEMLTKQNQSSHFLNPSLWKLNNQNFIFGPITSKSETSLLTQQIHSHPFSPDSDPPIPLFALSLTYCTFKTLRISNILSFANTVLFTDEIIQPSEGLCSQLAKKHKTSQILQRFFNTEQLENSLLQISFSDDNQQLHPFQFQNCVLSVKMLYPAYEFEVLVSVDKLINDECKLIVPSPIKNLPDDLMQDSSFVDGEISKSLLIALLPMKNLENHSTKNHMQQQENHKNNKNSNNDKNHSVPPKNDFETIEEEYPSMDQVYGSDAYMQQAEQPFKTQSPPNDKVCIECPFCGHIAHVFVSRCPECNEEWGYFA